MAVALGVAGTISTVRTGASAIAADSATLTDANIPPSSSVNCFGCETVFVGVTITGGTNPTMTLEPLFRSADDADGSRWHRLKVGALSGVNTVAPAQVASQTTNALADDETMEEVRVFGHSQVFFRISAVANATNTTAWAIRVMPGRYIPTCGLQRG